METRGDESNAEQLAFILRAENLAAHILTALIRDKALWETLKTAASRRGIEIVRGHSIEAVSRESLQPLYKLLYASTYGALYRAFNTACKCNPRELSQTALFIAAKELSREARNS